MTRGAVACGHPATAAAALEILEDGGNAFDAALAGLCAAAAAEPVLCSLGGGGFLMAAPAGEAPRLFDFFVATPHARRPAAEIDFYPIQADFGTATQEFHIGIGSIATPGTVAGLFAVHRALASLPMARIMEPAIRLAREGVVLRPVDAYLFEVVGAILTARADSRGPFTRVGGALLGEGDRFRLPALADSLAALAAEGEALFYRGELGQALLALCRREGGQLTERDLADYRVAVRRPLARRYRASRIHLNPPPSTGGILIAFALAMLAEHAPPPARGSSGYVELLARVAAATNRARDEQGAGDALLDPQLVALYHERVAGRPRSHRGTTHISVADAAGNLAALTLSNGEGCGYLLPDTGIVLNNMLGEEDLNPGGFHRWPRGTRLASMMAPTIAEAADGSLFALGSGGSNRIRSAIQQVLMALIDYDAALEDAVTYPRLHYENRLLNLEGALGAEVEVSNAFGAVTCWPPHNLFFGGVHTVARRPDGTLEAAADPRRGGAAALTSETRLP